VIYNSDFSSLELKSPSWLCLRLILSWIASEEGCLKYRPPFVTNALEQAVKEGDNPVDFDDVGGMLRRNSCHTRILATEEIIIKSRVA